MPRIMTYNILEGGHDRVHQTLMRNFSAYDAVYVALAEGLRVSLVTTDGRLARAGGHRAKIQAF